MVPTIILLIFEKSLTKLGTYEEKKNEENNSVPICKKKKIGKKKNQITQSSWESIGKRPGKESVVNLIYMGYQNV